MSAETGCRPGRTNRNASRNARGCRCGWPGSSGLRAGLVGAHAVALAADVEDGGVAEQAVDDGGGDDRIGEDMAPVGEAAIRGQDDRALVGPTADDLEDPVGRGLVEREVAQLVDHQDRWAEVGAE